LRFIFLRGRLNKECRKGGKGIERRDAKEFNLRDV
jgi:hypothetical protein